MRTRLSKHYRHALYSSLYITLSLSILIAGFLYYYQIPLWILFFFSAFCYVLCFGFIHYYTRRFIYQKIHDIYKTIYTDLNIYEEEPVTNIDSLSKEVERFSEDKRLQIEDLKLRDNFRKEFVGNLAHELKTPLFTVQSYLLTLQDGAIDNMEVRDNYIDRAIDGTERLVHIVEDLDMITKLETEKKGQSKEKNINSAINRNERLVHIVEDLDTITKIETGKKGLNKEKMDVVDLTQSVFDMLEVVAEEKNISLAFDTEYNDPIYVYADSEKIFQVLTNLTLNSIKYGRQNGTTEVAFDNQDDKILVRINDNGGGIAKEHLPRLFERFYRVDKSGSRKQGGSGLGLSIVKHMIEAHQERIQVESEIGLGTEFSFTLQKFEKNNT